MPTCSSRRGAPCRACSSIARRSTRSSRAPGAARATSASCGRSECKSPIWRPRRRRWSGATSQQSRRRRAWSRCRRSTTWIFRPRSPACGLPILLMPSPSRRATLELRRAAQDRRSEATVEEFGRRFLLDRILVVSGPPKSIVDRFEEIHFATGANGGFILAADFPPWTIFASSSSSWYRSCIGAACPRQSMPDRCCATT